MPPPGPPSRGSPTLTAFRDATHLRMVGAALYASVAFTLAGLCFPALLSTAHLTPSGVGASLRAALHPRAWFLGGVVCLVVVWLPLAAHAAALRPAAAAAARKSPSLPPAALARLPPGARPAAGAALAVAARLVSPLTAQSTVVFMAACASAGWAGVPLYARLRGAPAAPAWAAQAGAAVGLAYAAAALARRADLLCYPALQGRRTFRVKRAVVEAVGPAACAAGGGLVLAAAGGAFGSGGGGGATTTPPPPPSSTAAALLGCLVVAYGLELGGRTLEVVFTERLAFDGHLGGGGEATGPARQAGADEPGAARGGRGPPLPPAARAANAALLDALAATERDPLLSGAVRHDLCAVAEGVGGAGSRRRALFADPSGAGWCVPVRCAAGEVADLLAAVAPALPGGGGGVAAMRPRPVASTSTTAPPPPPPVRWNARPGLAGPGALLAAPLSSSTTTTTTTTTSGRTRPPLPAARAAALAAAAVQARWQDADWALRTLGALAAASATEDAYGAAQLAEEGDGGGNGGPAVDLGSTLAALLAAARGLAALVGTASAAVGGGGGEAAPAAAALASLAPWSSYLAGPSPPPALRPGAPGGVDAAVASLADTASLAAARAVAAFTPDDARRALASAQAWPVAGGSRAELSEALEAVLAEGGR